VLSCAECGNDFLFSISHEGMKFTVVKDPASDAVQMLETLFEG
jgi:hypothetical protein